MNGQDLQKRQPGGALASQAKGRGLEEPIQREDLLIPRAKLMQPTSPEILDGIEGLKLGMIINSLTKDVLPEEFIPIFKFTQWIRFNSRNKDDSNFDPAFDLGQMIWRSNDPENPRVLEEGKFGPNGEPPKATKFLNFFSLFPGVNMPIIVSFCNTSYKVGKQLLSLAAFSGADMFARQYSLKSKVTKNDKGTFYIFELTPTGLPKEDNRKKAEAWWMEFARKAQDIEVHGGEKVEE